MAVNLSALSTVTTTATALSNLILVSPQQTIGYQPQNDPTQNGQTNAQKPALLFHYEGEQTATLQSDITDEYVEDNTAINDQISLKPEEVTTHGYIGELNDIAPPALAALELIADKLTVIDAYTPALSTTALIAYNTAFQLYQTAANAASSAVSAWSSVAGNGGESVISGNDGFPIALEPNQNKQQTMFQQFYGYWRNRTLFTVQTPWAVYQNMAIKTLRAIQEEDTNQITDFEVTFKIIRFASTESVSDGSNAQGRAATQSSSLTDFGTSTPVSSMSLTDGLSANYPGSFATGAA